jgi:hypothetical protein
LIPSAPSTLPIVTPTAAPIPDQRQHSKHVSDFYRLYGWVKPGASVPDADLPKATRKIQRKLKKPVTGAFSDKMMTMMSGPYNATDTADTPDLDKRYVLC